MHDIYFILYILYMIYPCIFYTTFQFILANSIYFGNSHPKLDLLYLHSIYNTYMIFWKLKRNQSMYSVPKIKAQLWIRVEQKKYQIILPFLCHICVDFFLMCTYKHYAYHFMYRPTK